MTVFFGLCALAALSLIFLVNKNVKRIGDELFLLRTGQREPVEEDSL